MNKPRNAWLVIASLYAAGTLAALLLFGATGWPLVACPFLVGFLVMLFGGLCFAAGMADEGMGLE